MLNTAIALLVAGISLMLNEFAGAKKEVLQHLATQAQIIGANTTAALSFDDRRAAEQTLQALRAEPSVVAAAIYTPEGRLFASYQRAGVRGQPPAHLICTQTAWAGDGRLEVVQDIVFQGDTIGRACLLADQSGFHMLLKRHASAIGLVVLLSSLIALAISPRLQRTISGPILHLAHAARTVSRNRDYSLRVARSSHDEIGILVDAFNEMLTQIQDRDRKLEKQRDDLEVLVSTRTADLQRASEQLRHQAYYDILTNLANRSLFFERLTQSVLHAQQHGQALAVLFLDLDHFKVVNDSLGHVVGDELLKNVAERLLKCARDQDTVARQGGDEFTLLLCSDISAEDVVRVADRLINALEQPFHCQGRKLHITASIGAALYPRDGRDAGTLMRCADAAMYRAKEQGRNNFQFYTEGLSASAQDRLTLEQGLRHALEREELFVEYQPVADAFTGEIVGAEALLRWHHPQRGRISPELFVPLLEDSGLIVPVGEWVLQRACAQLAAWRNAGLALRQIAVNFSSRQFRHQGTVEVVREALEQNRLEPERLIVEITERVLIDTTEETMATVHALSGMGVQLAIDDFGTGYASLTYLKRLPIDTLKIDRSFVQNVTSDPDDAAIVRASIAMAHSLSLRVIAEGVETEAQLAFLCQAACDEVQGYLLGRPLPPEGLEELLRNSLSANARKAVPIEG